MVEKSGVAEIDLSILKKDIRPPADRNQSTVIFDPGSKTVTISGVFLNGPTNLTLERGQFDYDPEKGDLSVEIREKAKEGVTTASDVQQTIPYRVDVAFDDSIPDKVEVVHKRQRGDIVYERSEEIF